MQTPYGSRLNVGVIAAIAFSAFCWICLYAAFADFAQIGFDLLARSSALYSVVGSALIVLHALGLVMLFLLAGGAVAIMVSEATQHDVRDRREFNGTSH